MSSMKPPKPDKFDGRRDALTVRAWLHSVEKYLCLVQIGQDVDIDARTAVDFASTFMTGTAANWWFTLVLEEKVPPTWEAFKLCVENEFVPKDSMVRARDTLYKLKQRTSVAIYLSDFRNIVIEIPGISDSEKLARFTEGLKPHILLEVQKASPKMFEEAAKIALYINGAFYGAGFFSNRGFGFNTGFQTGPVPMEIGNVQRQNNLREISSEKMRDLKNNASFLSHKPGCLPWKPKNGKNQQKKKIVQGNNTETNWTPDNDSRPQEN
ncbi:hypothetical protein BWQ96_08426 [Gracilariopsis chorda]|uniref:Retrotransposon gag domain-containing protein n=1 Tax=Gracilariopsis chorda TaxID=448386 RepID=A0A2V3IID8_9FLOR|nr:hypothetical protein BWQ96_08426 [Gracilariopsis chorda]|eukprot:PXF41847.1 hypothetical protein BWQ96_08426 [Gracilariopsis chorda]